MTPIGIDIAKHKFDAAAYLGGKYKNKIFANTPEGFSQLLGWLKGFGQVHVCLEATGRYGQALATYLADAGVVVSMVNPARIAAFAKAELTRTKTDRGDARLIARFCALHQPKPWQPMPRNLRELQSLVRRLENLLQMQQMERNRLEGSEAAVRESLQAVLATLDKEIERTRKQIKAHIDSDPDLRQRADLLDSIPGVGPATIPVLLTLLGQPTRFAGPRQVGAFAGLNPALRQSGTWQGKTRLSKTGDAHLRKSLYLPALVAWRHNPAIRAFCERLKSRGKHGKAILGAAMRKLLCLAYGVLKSGKPFDPNLTVEG
jgi:transposase